MKAFLLFCLFSVLIISCEFQKESATNNQQAFRVKVNKLSANKEKINSAPSLNPQLTSGILPKINICGDTISYQCYVNGEKHGPFYERGMTSTMQINGETPKDGFYKHGQKHGFFNRYRAPGDLHYVAYYENDEFIWAGYQGMMEYELYPIRPLHIVGGDITIEAPHSNGQLWFKGRFLNGEPIGMHKFYHADGSKFGWINYKDSTVVQFWDENNPDEWSFKGEKY